MEPRAAVVSAQRAARWPAVLLGLTIPVSVAADNILLALLILACAVALMRRELAANISRHPVARASLLLFALLALGALYGERYPGDAARFLLKYLDLALLPLMLVAFADPRTRRVALYALAGSLLVTLVLSIGLWAGIVPDGPFTGDADNASVFKKDLTHNFLMAFGAFLFLQLGFDAATRGARAAWWVCAVLAVADVLLIVRGRTGYIVLVALMLYSGYAWKGARGLLGVAILAAAAGSVLLLTPNLFSARFERTMNEAKAWHGNRVAPSESIDMRLEWYRNSLGIALQHPLAGVGTGGFPKAYAEYAAGTSGKITVNPHNEFLHIGVQIGIVGLAALLWLFVAQWRAAPRLPTPLETRLARGFLIAFIVGCVFNSLLLDHTEGLLYAWLTALLYGGLDPVTPRQAPHPA